MAGRVIEEISLQDHLDRWLSLPALSQYSCLSLRSLRAYLTEPHHPLPHYRMGEPHVIKETKPRKAGEEARERTVSGKILVRRSDFDHWMEKFRHIPDLDKIVNDVLADLQK